MSVRHTYGGKRRVHPYAPQLSSPSSSQTDGSEKTRPPLTAISNRHNATKRVQSKSTQLHLDFLKSTRSCKICALTYTIGAPEDEKLHKAHCSRISKGLLWGKEEERETQKANVRTVSPLVNLKSKGKKGRILAVDCNIGGRIGTKVTTLMESINLFLSAPPLTQDTLSKSKAYLFLVHDGQQEHVAGTLIVTRIREAMKVAVCDAAPGEDYVHVEGGLYCHPERLPTPMGVARIFVSSAYRRLGIGSALLDAAAATFIHACPLSPERGEIAFSQPTSMGRQVMDAWGRGNARIYEE